MENQVMEAENLPIHFEKLISMLPFSKYSWL